MITPGAPSTQSDHLNILPSPAPPSSPTSINVRPCTSSLAHQRLGFENMRPRFYILQFLFHLFSYISQNELFSTGEQNRPKYDEENVDSIHYMQNYDIEVVEDTKEDDDDTSLDIRNESGESYEDMVSILPSEPVKIFRIKWTNEILFF